MFTSSRWSRIIRSQGYVTLKASKPHCTQSGITLASLALAAPLFRADRDALVGHVPAMQDAAARLAVLLPHP